MQKDFTPSIISFRITWGSYIYIHKWSKILKCTNKIFKFDISVIIVYDMTVSRPFWSRFEKLLLRVLMNKYVPGCSLIMGSEHDAGNSSSSAYFSYLLLYWVGRLAENNCAFVLNSQELAIIIARSSEVEVANSGSILWTICALWANVPMFSIG